MSGQSADGDDAATYIESDENAVIIKWVNQKTLTSFRTNVPIHGGDGLFVNVGISHIPVLGGSSTWNAIWLNSWTDSGPYLEIDIFEHNTSWWSQPKMSVHSSLVTNGKNCGAYGNETGNCGFYLDGQVEHGGSENPQSKLLVYDGETNIYTHEQNGDGWFESYNEHHANSPASWYCLIHGGEVYMGVSVNGWKPNGTPSVSDMTKNSNLLWVTQVPVDTSMPQNLLFASSSPSNSLNTGEESYWKIDWLDVYP